MPPTADRSPGPARPPARRRPAWRGRRREEGQSLVEFSLILLPLFLLILGIVQFGFIFNTYITMSNATREAAREGSIYIYNYSATKGLNDLNRNSSIEATLLASMNGLSTAAPQFTAGSTWTSATSGTTMTYTNGDIAVVYTLPGGVTDTDARAGWQITVRATYHQDLVIPLISALLPKDANGRLGLGSEVTMVIN